MNPLPSTQSALVPFCLNRVPSRHDGDLHSDVALILPPTIFETLFARKDAIKRHREALFLSERETFLRRLLEKGRHPKTVCDTAELLLHVIRVMKIAKRRDVSQVEIREAGRRWACESLSHRPPRKNKTSARRFVNVAIDWFRFHNLLLPPSLSSCHFDYAFEEFATAMQDRLSYLPMTIASICRPVKRFLLKMATRHGHLSSISIQDIDDYLGEGRREGWRPRTIVSHCQALRAFLRHAESQGWCRCGLARTVRNPRVRARDWVVTGPSWEEIRRTIDTLRDSNPSQCRTKAILLASST
jgi:hypothetical protein